MIAIDNLQFGYGRHLLYDGFAARVEQPGIYGLFGRNGSGKSTLLKLICGLLTPWAGQLLVLGRNPAHARRTCWRPSTSCRKNSTCPT